MIRFCCEQLKTYNSALNRREFFNKRFLSCQLLKWGFFLEKINQDSTTMAMKDPMLSQIERNSIIIIIKLKIINQFQCFISPTRKYIPSTF